MELTGAIFIAIIALTLIGVFIIFLPIILLIASGLVFLGFMFWVVWIMPFEIGLWYEEIKFKNDLPYYQQHYEVECTRDKNFEIVCSAYDPELENKSQTSNEINPISLFVVFLIILGLFLAFIITYIKNPSLLFSEPGETYQNYIKKN